MLPMGGPKGSALAIMMDGMSIAVRSSYRHRSTLTLSLVFSGVLSGSAFAGGVTNPYDPSKPADVGHFLIVLKPDLFISLDDFRDRMQVLYDRVHGSSKMAGVDRIYFPGEIEQVTEQDRRQNGVPFKKSEIEALNAEARRVGSQQLPT